jgi:hypothetical protein
LDLFPGDKNHDHDSQRSNGCALHQRLDFFPQWKPFRVELLIHEDDDPYSCKEKVHQVLGERRKYKFNLLGEKRWENFTPYQVGKPIAEKNNGQV